MKSKFYKDIDKTLGVELKKSGFRLAPLISNGEYCVFVKRYSKNIGLYIMCNDNRPQGGDVSITLWIAPIQCPDDGIIVRNLGVRIVVFSDYDVSDEIMYAVGKKVNKIVDNISSLAVVVEKDIEEPFIKSRSTKWFFYSREIYLKIEDIEDIEEDFENVRKLAQNCVDNKVSFDKLQSACVSFMSSLSNEFFSNEILSLTSDEKGELLADALYAEIIAK